MKRQQGFTLIELVVVIVILAIIGAVALPKFINLSSDAKAALVLDLAGMIKSANNLVYSKSVMAGNDDQFKDPDDEDKPYVLNSAGEPIKISRGHVLAEWNNALQNSLDIDAIYANDSDGSTWIYRVWTNGSIIFSPPGEMEINSNCNVTYYNDPETTEDIYLETDTDGC
ncbi:MAG: prepilin-type N-terminal cleavage/methylation domain-containing protein [Colwellia sp.]